VYFNSATNSTVKELPPNAAFWPTTYGKPFLSSLNTTHRRLKRWPRESH
jgi:hypothetical protein